MGNVAIQTNLVSPGQGTGLQNLTDNYLELIRSLVKLYVPGLSTFYKGLRSIEAEDVAIPCLMAQPVNVDPKMTTTAKMHKYFLYDLYYVVGGNTVDDATVKMTDVGEIFMKLFSNNALNDFNTAGRTNQFKTYGTNWVDSEMTQVNYGVAIMLGRPTAPKYVAVGNFQLRLETQKLV